MPTATPTPLPSSSQTAAPEIAFAVHRRPTVAEYTQLLVRSGLAKYRPVADPDAIRQMIEHGNLFVTAWIAHVLVGAARTLTDFAYFGYLADLCVDVELQKCGVGRELIRLTRERMGSSSTLLLLSAPEAHGYYPKLGFRPRSHAWILRADETMQPTQGASSVSPDGDLQPTPWAGVPQISAT